MPESKFMIYKGKLNGLMPSRIKLNVDYLASGDYEIQIIHNQKIIKTIHFEKS